MAAIAPRPRAVLIDLDGTMVDSAPDIAAAANRMLAELGAPPLPQHTVRGFIGKGVANLVRQVLAATPGLASSDEAAALAAFERHYIDCNGRHSTLYPGVLQGLSALRRLGYPLACVTNKPRPYTVALLEAMGLAPSFSVFSVVACADAATPLKPDPALLLWACRQLGAAPADSVMVGDSAVDAAAAARAGMPVYLVRYGYHGDGALAALDCAGQIAALSDLPALLSREAQAARSD
jgi:phosphoglycolate phosphatase